MNIRTIANVSLCLALLSMSSGALAQSESRWQNVNINQQNREPRRANFFAFENLEKAQSFDKKKSANYLSMEGMWKFNFVKDHNKRPANFFALKYDDSQWKDFPVPGLFELNGYGDATYKNIGYAWATQFDPNLLTSASSTTIRVLIAVRSSFLRTGRERMCISTWVLPPVT